jgi:hypothetical protein
MAYLAYDPGVKSEARAMIKASVRYGPAEGEKRFRNVMDFSRLTVIFSNCGLLLATLDDLLSGKQGLDIVRVCNYFDKPTRLGERFVEVLVVVTVSREDGTTIPHICELKLEELRYWEARADMEPHVEEFMRGLGAVHNSGPHLDYVGQTVLASAASEGRQLRLFKSRLTRYFGSVVAAWRRLCPDRIMTFQRFIEIGHTVKFDEFRECAVQLWQELDAGLIGRVSLFDFDADAVRLLLHFRHVARSCLHSTGNALDIFFRLEKLAFAKEAGKLQVFEFRKAAEALGILAVDADRIFRHLLFSKGPGQHLHTNNGILTSADFVWLDRIDTLVDTSSVLLVKPATVETYL